MIYLIGSLRNPRVPEIAAFLRRAGYEVFDDWYASGPEADDRWQQYEQGKGLSYLEALQARYGRHTFHFDYLFLTQADSGILITPSGRSGHMELGWLIGRGRPGYILLDKPLDRWDVMYQLATGLFEDIETLLREVGDQLGKRT